MPTISLTIHVIFHQLNYNMREVKTGNCRYSRPPDATTSIKEKQTNSSKSSERQSQYHQPPPTETIKSTPPLLRIIQQDLF